MKAPEVAAGQVEGEENTPWIKIVDAAWDEEGAEGLYRGIWMVYVNVL